MNASQIGEIAATLLGSIGIGLIIAHVHDLWKERREKGREDIANAIRNARRAGYLQGANNTMTVWGAHARAIQGVDLHGFAEDCRKCGLITLSLIPASEEYWTCKSCQHRNPAPLPPRLRSQQGGTPNPDPAKHDDP